jgi:hypothetical protein
MTSKRRIFESIVWGKPDSSRRPLCALCHGALPDVPFIMWKPDGSAASFCDKCAEDLFEVLTHH